MTKSMYDCAYLPSPTPTGYEVAGGYVMGRGAANLWTPMVWARAATQSRFLLPIATCWTPFTDGGTEGVSDAHMLMSHWNDVCKANGWIPQRSAFALDVEYAVAQAAGNSGYIQHWRDTIRGAGCYDIVYSSASTSGFLGHGPRWIAFGHMGGDVVIVQTKFLGSIDVDVVDDAVPLFDTKATAPPPSPKIEEEMTYYFTCKNHPNQTWAKTPYTFQSNGIEYRPHGSPQDFDTQRIFMAQQGIPAPAHQDVVDLDFNTVVKYMKLVQP